jgi:hypothetical protein
MLNYSNTQPKKIKYNNVDAKSVVYNGKTIWTAGAVPFQKVTLKLNDSAMVPAKAVWVGHYRPIEFWGHCWEGGSLTQEGIKAVKIKRVLPANLALFDSNGHCYCSLACFGSSDTYMDVYFFTEEGQTFGPAPTF